MPIKLITSWKFVGASGKEEFFHKFSATYSTKTRNWYKRDKIGKTKPDAEVLYIGRGRLLLDLLWYLEEDLLDLIQFFKNCFAKHCIKLYLFISFFKNLVSTEQRKLDRMGIHKSLSWEYLVRHVLFCASDCVSQWLLWSFTPGFDSVSAHMVVFGREVREPGRGFGLAGIAYLLVLAVPTLIAHS